MGLFEPAWKNKRLKDGVNSDKIIKSVLKVNDENELVEIFYTSPHYDARVRAMGKISKEKAFEIAMKELPSDFYTSLNNCDDIIKGFIFDSIMNRFQKTYMKDYSNLVLDEEGMNKLRILSKESPNEDVREYATKRIEYCEKRVRIQNGDKEDVDAKEFVRFLRSLPRSFKESILRDKMFKLMNEYNFPPELLREIALDTSIDIHARVMILKYENLSLGSREDIQKVIDEICEGEAKDKEFHAVRSQLYDRLMHAKE